MNAVSNIPLPGLAPSLSPQPPAARSDFRRRLRKLKDLLVAAYAYGLLSFGLLFPFALAAWHAFFGPANG